MGWDQNPGLLIPRLRLLTKLSQPCLNTEILLPIKTAALPKPVDTYTPLIMCQARVTSASHTLIQIVLNNPMK